MLKEVVAYHNKANHNLVLWEVGCRRFRITDGPDASRALVVHDKLTDTLNLWLRNYSITVKKFNMF